MHSFPDNILFPTRTLMPVALPLFSGKVAAGFPSPADDYVEKTQDLNELLVQKPPATFFVRVESESMLGAGSIPMTFWSSIGLLSRYRARL